MTILPKLEWKLEDFNDTKVAVRFSYPSIYVWQYQFMVCHKTAGELNFKRVAGLAR